MTRALAGLYTLINAGAKTRTDFAAGLHEAPFRTMRSKETILHIREGVEPTFVYQNEPIDLKESPYVFIRLRATDAHFCGMLTEYLAHHGVPTNDPIHLSYPHSEGKITQMLLLSLAGIRTPETFIFREESFQKNREYLLAHMQFPAVYKLDGSQGRDVHLMRSFQELEEILRAKKPHRLALVQPFIENTFDTRTLVAFGEVLGTIKRERTHGYLNNVAQGATISAYNLTDTERDIAIQATAACRIDFGGVDMIHTPEGPVVLEINKSPQIAGFESVHNFKVFTKIAEIIASRRN